MTDFTIKDLENFSGIKAHTIRTWEQRFTFLRPRRSDKLRRTYSLDELRLILDVSFLNHNGHKVSQIAAMDGLAMEAAANELSGPQQLHEKCVNGLLYHMAAMDVASFEDVLRQGVHRWGIDVVLTQMVLPFAEKTGLFGGSAPKHYRTNLLLVEGSVRQKILVGIEESAPQPESRTALFYIAKRSNDLELLYLQYQFKQKGFHTVGVTGPVAVPQLTAVAGAVKPDFVVTSLPERSGAFDLETFAAFLRNGLPQTAILHLKDESLRYKHYPEPVVPLNSRAAALAAATGLLQAV